jgi:predicted nucleic acid-binding protein
MPDSLPLFLDTAYVYAQINTRDQWHEAAVRWESRLAATRQRLLTTEFVLIEIADGLSAIRFRAHAIRVIDLLRSSPLVEVIPASAQLFASAMGLYRNRDDKDWGLTDCSSFVVMREHHLSDVLTTDEHFRQAGFRPLLLDPSG